MAAKRSHVAAANGERVGSVRSGRRGDRDDRDGEPRGRTVELKTLGVVPCAEVVTMVERAVPEAPTWPIASDYRGGTATLA